MDSATGLFWSATDAKEKKRAVLGDGAFAENVVVLKLDLRSESDKKEVMLAVSSLSGVDSISVNMKENNLTVKGNFDPVMLTLLVRKKCHADIESVGPANKYKPEKEKDELSSASEELSSVLENPGMHYSSSSHFSAKRKLEYDASYMKRFKYDVFISFRAEGPRESFADYLYEALVSERIVAFRDDVRLERGETVSDQLVKAIEDSWSAVVVLSQDYISSSRCLEELAKLLECREETGLVVLPVFYNVHPFDVRHITGDVGEAFHRFKDDCVDAAKLQRWERALKMAVDFKGWTSAKGHETELVERIVDWISSWLLNLELESLWAKKAQMNKDAGKHWGDLEMSLAKDHIIGIDDQVERITELMNMESDRVLVIGICGADGIGKTSLAKAVYNRLSSQFDAHCFLKDIKEEELMTGGILSLQFKVARDILCSDYGGGTTYGEGFEVLKEVLPHMKVLVVLDDLEHVSQIKELTGLEPHLFGLGSMIIVTTKGGNFSAVDLGEDSPVHYCVQPVSLMNADLALQLFNLHVFGKNSPGPDYKGIAKTIVNGLKGYPLLNEVIGSLLHGKEQEEFKELSKLIDRPALSFSDLLKVAYEALDEMQQQIFLDIACCIANEDVQTAKYMWCDCLNWYPNCILMPLAKLGYGGDLWMHSSLRHFGRQIVRAEDKGNSGICSRVFVHQIAMDILKNGKGAEQVEALCLDFGDHPPEKFSTENFKKMPNLRFLRLDSAHFTGNSGDVFPKLRWLKWQRCPMDFEATIVHMEELVILDLSRSAVTEDWKGWYKIKMVNLKVLNLANCADLITTPRFQGFPNLNRLILEGCMRLVHIDPSICTLKCLVYLNLKFCRELNNLPKKLGNLEALRELWVDGTGVEEIPMIGKLKRLESLSAPNCSSLGFLPYSIGKLEKLRELSLGGCRRLQELSDSIGELGSSLLLLDISGTGIAELPKSISGLQSLKVLKLDSCFLSELPETIGCLHNLEEIHASRCRNLKDITPKIGELSQLRILELRYATIAYIPESIENLHKLETLDLLHCDNIKQLPRLPSGLKVLHVNPELRQEIQLA